MSGGVLGLIPGRCGVVPASVTVVKEVPAVFGVDPMELFQVRPENPLESDSRGSADFECNPNSKSSITYPLVISSSMRSSSSESFPSS